MTSSLSTRSLVLIAIGVAVNIALGQLASTIKLPIFLDSIGTMLVAVMGGPVVGGLAGLLTNLLWGLIKGPTAAFFAPVAMVIGIAAGLLARAGFFQIWWKAAIAGVIIAIALAFVAVPIRIFLFGGVTGSGADFAVAYLLKVGQTLFSSVLLTVIGTNLADKVITALITWGIVRGLPQRSTSDWPFLSYSRA